MVSKMWNTALDKYIQGLGFKQSKSDPCIYVSTIMDDIILASNNDKEMEGVKKDLSDKFEIKDLGELSYCIGINVKSREDGSVWMGKSMYTESVLEKHGMDKAKPISTPVDVGSKLTKAEKN